MGAGKSAPAAPAPAPVPGGDYAAAAPAVAGDSGPQSVPVDTKVGRLVTNKGSATVYVLQSMENNVGKLQDVVLGNTIDAPLAELTYLAFSTVKVEGAIAGQLPGVKSASFTSTLSSISLTSNSSSKVVPEKELKEKEKENKELREQIRHLKSTNRELQKAAGGLARGQSPSPSRGNKKEPLPAIQHKGPEWVPGDPDWPGAKGWNKAATPGKGGLRAEGGTRREGTLEIKFNEHVEFYYIERLGRKKVTKHTNTLTKWVPQSELDRASDKIEIEALKKQLEEAKKNEAEAAARVERKLRAEKEREELIARLEKEKGEAIELEDYTKAKELKVQLAELKEEPVEVPEPPPTAPPPALGSEDEAEAEAEDGQKKVEEGGLVGRVVVRGMEGPKAELNGLKGNADKFDKGCYYVTLDNGKKMKFRPQYLAKDTAVKQKEKGVNGRSEDHSEDGDIEE